MYSGESQFVMFPSSTPKMSLGLTLDYQPGPLFVEFTMVRVLTCSLRE